MSQTSTEKLQPTGAYLNPRIIHRVYCPTFRPFFDPYTRYLESWKREMPDYEVVHWNEDTIDFSAIEWLEKCYAAKSPVYISEYVRWWALRQYGGLYLDADCEILNGTILDDIVSDLYNQDQYDIVFGIEAKENGYPTAQTVAAKPTSDLVHFMCDLYENRLSPLFQWRDSHALIGPRLMGLYLLDQGFNIESGGFFVGLEEPTVIGRMKVLPQTYFSPKFSLLGETLDYQEGKTCVYHLFGNANVDFSKRKLHKAEKTRTEVLTFDEYRESIARMNRFPRTYDFSHFQTQVGEHGDDAIKSTGKGGVLAYGPYIELPKGCYSCRFDVTVDDLQAVTRLAVTSRAGHNTLAASSFPNRESATLSFVLEEDTKDIEFVVECKDHKTPILFKGNIVDVKTVEDDPQDIFQLSRWKRYLRGVQKKLGRETS